MNSGFSLFGKLLISLVSASLLVYAFVGLPLGLLARLLALSLGVSLVAPLAYPHLRGVKRGDSVVAVNRPGVPFFHMHTFVALEDGKIGGRIHVSASENVWREAVIVSYAGLLTPAKVRVLENEFNVNIV